MIWFGLFCFVLLVTGVYCAVSLVESPIAFYAALFVGIGVLNYVFSVPIFSWIIANPLMVIVGFVGYFLIGGLWSIYKFKRFANSESNIKKVKYEFDNYCNSNKSMFSKMSGSEDKEFDIEKAKKEFVASRYNFSLHPANHYSKFITWISSWPFGVFWSILYDPITWASKKVYKVLSRVYTNIAEKAFDVSNM